MKNLKDTVLQILREEWRDLVVTGVILLVCVVGVFSLAVAILGALTISWGLVGEYVNWMVLRLF